MHRRRSNYLARYENRTYEYAGKPASYSARLFTIIFCASTFDFCVRRMDCLHYHVKMCCTSTIKRNKSAYNSLHYHMKLCYTSTDSNSLQYPQPLHYHVKVCCTATYLSVIVCVHYLHYHVKVCCTATSSNGITDYYKILTLPRMTKV